MRLEGHHRGRDRYRGRNRIRYRCGFSSPDFDCDPDSDADRFGARPNDNFCLAANLLEIRRQTTPVSVKPLLPPGQSRRISQLIRARRP